MSREFGDYGGSGFMHDKVEAAADDCASGRCDLARLLGDVLSGLSEIAYGVSSVEAYDWGEGHAISHAIGHMPRVERAMVALRRYLDPYRQVMDDAVCRAVDARPTCEHERRITRGGNGKLYRTCATCGHQIVEAP